MNKPDTKELRDRAFEMDRHASKDALLRAADFIESLEGKTILNGEWPKRLTRERLEKLAEEIGYKDCFKSPVWPNQYGALSALAAIAPEAPKKRRAYIYERELPHGMIERAWHDSEWPCHAADGGWRKVGECEID